MVFVSAFEKVDCSFLSIRDGDAELYNAKISGNTHKHYSKWGLD